MTIIKIAPHENGSHDNQTINGVTPEIFPVPDGYALVPEDLGTPETLPNYPFGSVTVEERDGIQVVTSWTPLPIPNFQEPEEPQYTEMQLLGQQLTDLELLVLSRTNAV